MVVERVNYGLTLVANLTPRKLRAIEEKIVGKAEALVLKLVQGGGFEAMDALARAFPLEIVADLTGGDGSGFPDNAVTIDDLLFCLLRFEAGC